jgi:preprotein translocase subunit SecE
MNSKQFVSTAIKFFSEVRTELSRVEWPSIPEFVGSTIVVLVFVAIFALFFGAVDRGISYIAQYIFTHSI